MLNRRILRAKAMQAVYAYQQAVQSDYQLALDTIANTFLPDLNSMQPQDARKLEGSRQWATLLFEENYRNPPFTTSDDVPADIRKATTTAIAYYYQQRHRDERYFAQTMLKNAEKIYEYYLLTLWLVTEIAECVVPNEEEKKNRMMKEDSVPEKYLKLKDNQIVRALQTHKGFQDKRIRSGIDLLIEPDFPKKLFAELKKLEAYQTYQKLDEASFEQDWQLIAEIVKTVLFKSETAVTFWEQLDGNWSENEGIVRSMFNKTMQFIKEQPNDFSLQKLSADWESDVVFFQRLYQLTTEKFDEYEGLIANKTENWDVERVALTDKVILVMAITELLNFPNIPVKVSINEYIEMSKVYSTPKSNQFINGILDSLSGDLSAQGVLKKSGRGLIDNK